MLLTMAATRRVLILFAHPALQKSHVNRRLAAAVRSLPGVTFHDLYEAYPDFNVDVEREQQHLVAHDVIVFQHPFYWYSCPALLKEWMDLVLEFGFAYGPNGTKLEGKRFLSAISTGGAASAYARTGQNFFTIPELLAPIEQTARLCRMEWLPPFVVHSSLTKEYARFDQEAARYAELITGLRDGRIEASTAGSGDGSRNAPAGTLRAQ